MRFVPERLSNHSRAGGLAGSALVAIAVTLALAASTRRRVEPARSPGEQAVDYGARVVAAQLPHSPVDSIAKGKFLIADRQLGDPNFAESVILLVEYNDDGAMGLIINDRTEVSLSRLLPNVDGMKERDDELFIGGPVQRKSMLLMLIRSRTKPIESTHVFADVYVTGSVAVLKQIIEKGWKDDRFRAYAGYAGWGPGQLDNEVAHGDWHVVAADADAVFAAKPDGVWKKLIDRASLLFAGVPAQAAGPAVRSHRG